MNKRLLNILIIVLLPWLVNSQSIEFAGCKAELNNNQLVLSNNLIQRTFEWNNGNLKTITLNDIKNNHVWDFVGADIDFSIPGLEMAQNGTIKFEKIQANNILHEHIKAVVTSDFGEIQVKRVFKIYPDCPALACDIYLKGGYNTNWTDYDKNGRVSTPVIERLTPDGIHWLTKSLSFYDRTDDNNNLVHENKQMVFVRQSRMPGNLIFVEPEFGNTSLFILKESPNHVAQLGYPGCDFVSFQTKKHNLELQVVGLNINTNELNKSEWIRCSGFVTGVSQKNELSQLSALKSYQEKIRVKIPERDEMIMMNTWGDRGQDANISEQFCIQEIKTAKKLGITYFQIDDGWQTGRTGNSADKGGSLDEIWNKQDYWKVDAKRFPNGLTPVAKEAKKRKIELGLWFNPSHDNSYGNWKKDAEVLINFYKEFGIKTFKIDGVIIADKLDETNFRSFLDTILLVSNNEIVINLDVTGLAARPGFHSFNEYGNVFLENRYTDWVNYYPHWSLRNLWMLSKYVPAQNLQLEFLNKWRNQSLYKTDDVLSPANIPFDYQFALTMMAQPLAWFEGSKLPNEAFAISKTIEKYGKVMAEIHSGKILPIGNEPSGQSWTGFQSIISETEGYILVLREFNTNNTNELHTWFPENSHVEFIHILGYGSNFTGTVSEQNNIKFSLPKSWNYALYKYKVVK